MTLYRWIQDEPDVWRRYDDSGNPVALVAKDTKSYESVTYVAKRRENGQERRAVFTSEQSARFWCEEVTR